MQATRDVKRGLGDEFRSRLLFYSEMSLRGLSSGLSSQGQRVCGDQRRLTCGQRVVRRSSGHGLMVMERQKRAFAWGRRRTRGKSGDEPARCCILIRLWRSRYNWAQPHNERSLPHPSGKRAALIGLPLTNGQA